MQWNLQPVGGFWFTAIVTGVLLALALVVPRPRPSGGRLLVLRSLRTAAVLLMLVALLRPTLIHTEMKPLEASLVVLIDSTRSMQVTDSLAGASRWDAVRRVLDDASAPLTELADRWDLRVYRFGGGVVEAGLTDGVFDLPREPRGDSTAIGAALGDALEQSGGERLLGVVLLSDGAQRALPPRDAAPQLAARRLAAEGVPLYAATFGRPGAGDRADLAVEDLAASDSAFVKTPAEVTGRLRVAGFANRRLVVQLLWEDAGGEMRVVDAESIDSGPQAAAYPFRLEHTPTEAGEQKLTVRVVDDRGGPPDGELITTNNEQSTFISVRDGGVRVLQLVGAKIVGGSPGREQRFVRAALAASPDIVVTREVFDYRRPRRGLELGRPGGDRPPPDVILLDDLDAMALDTSAWRTIAEAVSSGAGLGMTGGYHSFGAGGHGGTPLEATLPVVAARNERQRFGEPIRTDIHTPGPLRMRPAEPLGARHPILQLSGDAGGGDLWPRLPELDGANRFDRARLKPNAVVLAETADSNARPLLVVGQSGAGRVLALAVDSTWRWRLGGFSEPHRRFWRQAVLWLAKKDDASQDPVWVTLDRRRVARGGRLEMRMGVRGGDAAAGDSGRPIRYRATVQSPVGKPFELPTTAGAESPATFTGADTPGDYTVKVEAYEGGAKLGEASARFSVPDQDLELDNPAAEPSLMAQLAATTSAAGGRSLAPEELPAFFQSLADEPPELEEEILARVTHWDTWPFFLLLVGLLGTEWCLRKRWGLV